MTSPKLSPKNLLTNLALLLFLCAPVSAEPNVAVKVVIQGDTLVVVTKGKTPEPAVRMNPNPSFLELAFPKSKLDSKAFSKAIDKGLVQKVVTSEEDGTSLARIYVLSKPKTSLKQTEDGYKYTVHLRDLAKASKPKPRAASRPSRVPARAPVASRTPKPPTPPVARSTPPVRAVRATAPTTGRKALVSAVFKNTSLDQALATLAKQAQVELQLDPAVAGSVTTAFQNVPLDQAVDKLLAVFGPSVTTSFEGQYLVVRKISSGTPAPSASAATASSPAAAATATGQSSEYYPFKGKDATKMMAAAKKAVPSLRYSVDPLLNILLVEGAPAEIQRLNQLIRAMSPK